MLDRYFGDIQMIGGGVVGNGREGNSVAVWRGGCASMTDPGLGLVLSPSLACLKKP